VYLDIGDSFKQPVIVDPIRVIEVPLIGQTNIIDCLIGRDILRHGILIYIGYANAFSFSI